MDSRIGWSGWRANGRIGATVGATHRFDATVEERCPGQSLRTRELGVVAIAEMGYWEPFYFASSG